MAPGVRTFFREPSVAGERLLVLLVISLFLCNVAGCALLRSATSKPVSAVEAPPEEEEEGNGLARLRMGPVSSQPPVVHEMQQMGATPPEGRSAPAESKRSRAGKRFVARAGRGGGSTTKSSMLSGEEIVPGAGGPISAPEPASTPALKPAKLAWNTPEAVEMGNSPQVELRITLSPERMAQLAERIKAPGKTTTDTADLATIVTATLSGTQFKVWPDKPQRQEILPGRDAVWIWSISPLAPGTHSLVLTVESALPEANVDAPFVRTIIVRAVKPAIGKEVMSFAEKNWQALITVVIIPLGGLLVSWWRKRRNASSDDELPPITPPPDGRSA